MTENKPMVLIVDDEPDMCWALENLLRQKGFDFRTAQTGRHAMTLVTEHRFRFALLDVKLGDMDGIELAKMIKAADPSVAIIMISGYYYRDDQDIRQAVTQGFVVGFIAKPFLHDEVISLLDSLGTPQ